MSMKTKNSSRNEEYYKGKSPRDRENKTDKMSDRKIINIKKYL